MHAPWLHSVRGSSRHCTLSGAHAAHQQNTPHAEYHKLPSRSELIEPNKDGGPSSGAKSHVCALSLQDHSEVSKQLYANYAIGKDVATNDPVHLGRTVSDMTHCVPFFALQDHSKVSNQLHNIRLCALRGAHCQ
jgi:hypothetical protein